MLSLKQRGVRVVEGARLESVYTSKGYRGFESLPLCGFLQIKSLLDYLQAFLLNLLPVFPVA